MSAERIPNHRFSIQRDREVSVFESKLDSLKSRLGRSIGINRPERREQDTTNIRWSSAPSIRMGGKNRNNRREDYGNDQWYSDNQGQDHITTNGVEGGQDKNHAQSNSISNFGPFSQAADEAISKMLTAKNAIEVLGDVFSRYSQEIKEIPNIQKKFEDMVTQCKHKDRVIRGHKVTIETLTQDLHEKMNEVADELAKLDGDKEALKEEKEAFKRQSKDADKKHKDLEMELKSNHEKILVKKETELKVVYDARQKALEEDKKNWEAHHSKMMKALETSNQEGKRRITDLETQLEACRAQLRDEKMRYEDLEAAKTKYREEKEELATKLQNLESEFSTDGQTDQFYKEKFLEIYDAVQSISYQFFDVDLSDKSPNELKTIRDQLVKVDSHFESIPISNSDISRTLIVAHAERVISAALQKYVWQPFSSDRTLPGTDTAILIRQIYDQVIKNTRTENGNGRSANLWKAHMTRALGSLCAQPSFEDNADNSTKSQSLPPTRCAEKVIADVLSVLSPLLESSQESHLRDELSNLVKSACAVWMSAEADELVLMLNDRLDRRDIQEWRSQEFDPPSSPSAGEKSGQKDIVSATLPRIYTLFPRIIAERTTKTIKTGKVMPCNWSDTELQAPSVELVCIHSGVGLTESSKLALSGKMEEEETSRMLKESAEKVYKRNDQRKLTNGGASRRGSAVSSIASPLVPSLSWPGRNRNVIEE